MTSLQLSRDPAEPEYLAGLQRNFDGWGTRADFDWWFRRRVGAAPADLLAFADGGSIVAGSAVSYRLWGEEQQLVATMTASWTDAAYRRRGLFGELIELSRSTALDRGATALLAFAGADRMSVERLAGTSEVVHDAWLLEPEGPAPDRAPDAWVPAGDELASWFHRNRLGARFAYPGEVFGEQLRLNEAATTVRNLGEGYWAVTRGGSLLALVSERRPEPGVVGAKVAESGAAAYTTVAEVAHSAAAMPSRRAFVFVMRVGNPIPGSLLAGLDLQGCDRA